MLFNSQSFQNNVFGIYKIRYFKRTKRLRNTKDIHLKMYSKTFILKRVISLHLYTLIVFPPMVVLFVHHAITAVRKAQSTVDTVALKML